jgi:hypothetical protein
VISNSVGLRHQSYRRSTQVDVLFVRKPSPGSENSPMVPYIARVQPSPGLYSAKAEATSVVFSAKSFW